MRVRVYAIWTLFELLATWLKQVQSEFAQHVFHFCTLTFIYTPIHTYIHTYIIKICKTEHLPLYILTLTSLFSGARGDDHRALQLLQIGLLWDTQTPRDTSVPSHGIVQGNSIQPQRTEA